MNVLVKSVLLTVTLSFASLKAYSDENILTVGIEGTCEPFVITNSETLEFSGFDIEIIRELAKISGYDNVEFKNMPFDALLPAVLTEQVDVAISGITINDDRSQIVDFIGPYFDAGLNAMIKAELKETTFNVNSLSGHKICVKNGTTCEAYATTIPNVDLVKFPSEKDSFEALQKNQCDALVSDDPIISYFLKQNPKAPFFKLEHKLTFEQFGIMVSKNRNEIYNKLQEGLKKIKENGWYDKVRAKWFGNNS